MKSFRMPLSVGTVCVAVAMSHVFWGCVESTPTQTGAVEQFESASVRLANESQSYAGGTIMTDAGITFHVLEGSVTLPSDYQRADVDVAMSVSEDSDGRLLFTFGPSGCQFNPPAEIHLNWKQSKPKLYFIDEQENFIEQNPADVILQDQHLKVYIRHFSRYAIDPD